MTTKERLARLAKDPKRYEQIKKEIIETAETFKTQPTWYDKAMNDLASRYELKRDDILYILMVMAVAEEKKQK